MNYDYKYLTPFKWFILENFPFIEADFDALTNWQLFCKLGKEMNKIIDSTNLTGEQVENLTNAFNELKSYVDNYFENLDVQDEINNKLDEMAESGQLADIIADYIQLKGILAYNTVAEMKQATNLVNGSFAETYGFYNVGDNGGAKYKIRTVTNDDVIDEMTIIALADDYLIAELVLEDTMNVNQFGASSQNTNNAPNIQKAIDTCSTIILNNETYNITSGLIINKPCKIVGNNNTRSLNAPTLYGENMAIISIYTTITGVILENFNIKSNYERDSAVTSNGIYCANNTYHLTFRNIQVSHCKNGILVSQTWNLLMENVITDTCDNGFNSAGTVTSSSFVSCISYNSHYGWYIRGGFVYSAFYSCGADHTDRAIRCEGSGSIDTYNFGVEDYQEAISIIPNNNGISLNMHNTFFYPSQRKTREILFQGNNINLYDCVFPDNCVINTYYPVNYVNCINIPFGADSNINGNYMNAVKKTENSTVGKLSGFKTYSANSTITLQRNQNADCYIIGKLLVGTSSKVSEVLISNVNLNHYVENPDTSLVSVTFSGYDMTITFLQNCNAEVDINYRNYK